MIAVEFLADWIGEDVIGSDGEKAGKLEEVYLDGPEPVIAEVKGGGLRRKTHLVPLDGAVAGRDYIRVSHASSLISGAPGGPDEGAPDASLLNTVAEHYGLRLRGEGTLEGSKARKARLAAEEEAERAEAEAQRARAEAERAARGDG